MAHENDVRRRMSADQFMEAFQQKVPQVADRGVTGRHLHRRDQLL
jgi:hypothetical protein